MRLVNLKLSILPQVGTCLIKMSLKITDNVTKIEEEVQDGDFNLNLKDHILHLPSFINPDICQDVVKILKIQDLINQHRILMDC